MKHISSTILFFGTEDFSAYTLQKLIDQHHSIGAIITKPDTQRGRSKQLVSPLVKAIGAKHGIPVWQPRKLADITADIATFNDPVGVLVSYGKIIPQSIINLFSPGIINLHPSLLPLYRGPSPIESAILNGDSQTGLSIMMLSAEMDAGPVYLQETVQLKGNETSSELYESLGKRGAELIGAHLSEIVNDSIIAVPQNEDDASYCKLITKNDGNIDWRQDTAQEIDRKIRAYENWPQCRATIGGLDVIITEAHVITDKSLAAKPGSVNINSNIPSLEVATRLHTLSIDRVKPVGKKEMPISAFLSGYAPRLSG